MARGRGENRKEGLDTCLKNLITLGLFMENFHIICIKGSKCSECSKDIKGFAKENNNKLWILYKNSSPITVCRR